MKKAVLFIGLCILFTGFVSFSSRAQEAPTIPEYYVVFEEIVSTADMDKFNEVQSKTVELWKKHNMDITLYCYVNDENSYYWVVPVMNFAGIDDLFKKGSEYQKKMQADGFDGIKEFRDLSTGRQMVIHWEQDLSYHPSGQFGQRSDNSYVEWTFFYMKQGHEKEASEVTKKYIDFYNSVPETYEWDVYSVIFGDDTPAWLFMLRAESEIALRKQELELNKKYGDKFKELWAEFTPHIRKVENKKGWFMADWSLNWKME
ncbi:MAG: hypothetical protein R3182_00975 [Draconibacterium sp.]|nr:hypothetical protein [Draconibacterium sp.]